MLPYSKIRVQRFRHGSSRRLQRHTPQSSGSRRDAGNSISLPGASGLGPRVLLSQKVCLPARDANSIHVAGRAGHTLPQDHTSLGTTEPIPVQLNITQTLNRQSEDPSAGALQLHRQSSSVIDTHNDSRLLRGGSSLLQGLPEADPLLVPTMLEVELGKGESRPGNRNAGTKFHTSSASGKPANLAVKTSEMQGGQQAGMLVQDSSAAGLFLQQPTSPSADPQQTQNEIIEDIARNFDRLKGLFPATALNKRSKERLSGTVFDHHKQPSTMKGSRNIAELIAMSRASAKAGAAGRAQTQQFTSPNETSWAASLVQRAPIPPKNLASTTVPSNPKSLQSTHSFPTRGIRQLGSKARGPLSRQKNATAKLHTTGQTEQQEFAGQKTPMYSQSHINMDMKSVGLQPQKQVTVLQLDGQNLSQLNTASYYSKKVSEQPGSRRSGHTSAANRYVAAQGPIKRLKSAMIRSVFDKGEGPNGSGYYSGGDFGSAGGLHQHGKTVLSKRKRRSPHKQLGRGINLSVTSPCAGYSGHLAPSLQDQQHAQAIGMWQPHPSDTESLLRQTPEYQQQLHQFFVAHQMQQNMGMAGVGQPSIFLNDGGLQGNILLNNGACLNETISSNGGADGNVPGIEGQAFGNLIMHQQQHLGFGELTPDRYESLDRQMLPAMGSLLLHGGSDAAELLNQSSEGNQIVAQAETLMRSQIAADQYLNQHQDDFLIGGEGEIHFLPDTMVLNPGSSIALDQHMSAELNTTLLAPTTLKEGQSPSPPGERVIQVRDGLAAMASRSLAVRPSEMTPPAGDGRCTEVRERERRSALGVDGEVTEVVLEAGSKRASQDFRKDERLSEAVSDAGGAATPISIQDQEQAANQHQKTQVILVGSQIDLKVNSPCSSSREADAQLQNSNQSMPLSGFSQPRLVSKIIHAGDQDQVPRVDFSGESSKEGAVTPVRPLDAFDEFESTKLRVLDLEAARRNHERLMMLKAEIEEDQFQMYDLTHGLQSGMIKIDPHYMNKAIVDKIRLQKARWEAKSAALSSKQLKQARPKSAAGAGLGARKIMILKNGPDGGSQIIEFGNGLREVQQVEELVEQRRQSLGQGQPEPPIAIVRAAVDPARRGADSESESRTEATPVPHSMVLAAHALPDEPPRTQIVDPNVRRRASAEEQRSSQAAAGDNVFTPDKPGRLNESSFVLMDTAMDGTAERRGDKTYSASPSQKKAAFLVIEEPCPPGGSDQDVQRVAGREGQSQSPIAKRAKAGEMSRQLGQIQQRSHTNVEARHVSAKPGGGDRKNQDLNVFGGNRAAGSKPPKDPVLRRSAHSGQTRPLSGRSAQLHVVISPAWLEQHQAKIVRPVKRFVNLNQQVTFAKIEPSILRRNESAAENRQKEASVTAMAATASVTMINDPSVLHFQQRGRSACEARPFSTQAVIQNSIATTSLGAVLQQQIQLKDQEVMRSRSDFVAAAPPQTEKVLIVEHTHETQGSTERAHYPEDPIPLGQKQVIDIDIGRQALNQNAVPVTVASPQQLPLSGAGSGRGPQPYSGSETNNSKERMQSVKDLKGASGQQIRFDYIDIEQLMKDKALTRHIHGGQPHPDQAHYELIRQMALAQAQDSKACVAREREKTMIPRQAADQRSLRNLRSALNANRHTATNAAVASSTTKLFASPQSPEYAGSKNHVQSKQLLAVRASANSLREYVSQQNLQQYNAKPGLATRKVLESSDALGTIPMKHL